MTQSQLVFAVLAAVFGFVGMIGSPFGAYVAVRIALASVITEVASHGKRLDSHGAKIDAVVSDVSGMRAEIAAIKAARGGGGNVYALRAQSFDGEPTIPGIGLPRRDGGE